LTGGNSGAGADAGGSGGGWRKAASDTGGVAELSVAAPFCMAGAGSSAHDGCAKFATCHASNTPHTQRHRSIPPLARRIDASLHRCRKTPRSRLTEARQCAYRAATHMGRHENLTNVRISPADFVGRSAGLFETLYVYEAA
jgi:hypothetical protein